MAVKPVPEGHTTVTVCLVSDDSIELVEFMQRAFDAKVIGRYDAPDGKSIQHAELQVGNSRVMVGHSSPHCPAMPTMLYLYVEDCDSAYKRGLDAGGKSLMAPATMFYGDRSGAFTDKSGNQWWVATHVEDVAEDELKRRMAQNAQQQAAGSGQQAAVEAKA